MPFSSITRAIVLSIASLSPFTSASAASEIADAAESHVVERESSAPETHPALWRIEDDDTSIYLFGTMHLLPRQTDWLTGDVLNAFDGADDLVLEVVEIDPNTEMKLVMERAVDRSGRNLRSRLSDADREAYNQILLSLGMFPSSLDAFEPWMAYLAVSVGAMSAHGYDIESGAEGVLTTRARERGMPIMGLETAEEQLDMLDTLSESVQLDLLTQSIREFDQIGQQIDQMRQMWEQGQIESLGAAVEQSIGANPSAIEIREVLLSRRNEVWAHWIADRLDQPGRLFVAVGAAHLVGADSVQARLETMGIEAVRVGDGTTAERQGWRSDASRVAEEASSN